MRHGTEQVRHRVTRHLALLGLLALGSMGARWDYSSADTPAALDAASERTRCVIGYETGWTWSPNLVGLACVVLLFLMGPRGEE